MRDVQYMFLITGFSLLGIFMYVVRTYLKEYRGLHWTDHFMYAVLFLMSFGGGVIFIADAFGVDILFNIFRTGGG